MLRQNKLYTFQDEIQETRVRGAYKGESVARQYAPLYCAVSLYQLRSRLRHVLFYVVFYNQSYNLVDFVYLEAHINHIFQNYYQLLIPEKDNGC